jgi:hypothetical protein
LPHNNVVTIKNEANEPLITSPLDRNIVLIKKNNGIPIKYINILGLA